jgi:hypothetical protein
VRRVRAGGGSLFSDGGSVEIGGGTVGIDAARLDAPRLDTADSTSSWFATWVCEAGRGGAGSDPGDRRLTAMVTLGAALLNGVVRLGD